MKLDNNDFNNLHFLLNHVIENEDCSVLYIKIKFLLTKKTLYHDIKMQHIFRGFYHY